MGETCQLCGLLVEEGWAMVPWPNEHDLDGNKYHQRCISLALHLGRVAIQQTDQWNDPAEGQGDTDGD